MNPFASSIRTVAWIDALQMVTAVAGLLLNGVLILGNHRRGRGRWATDGILITATALLDCLSSLYILASTAMRIATPATVRDGSAWCLVNFIVGRSLGTSCLSLVMILSLVRYFVIVRSWRPRPQLWSALALGTVLALTLATAFRASSASLFVYPSGMYCRPVTARQSSASALASFVFYMLCVPPLFVIPLCYARVSCHYARLVNSLDDELVALTRIRSSALGIVLVALAYWVAVVPYILVFYSFRIFGLVPSPTVDGLAYWLKSCTSLINALFPILLHAEIRHRTCEMFFAK